MLSLSSIVSYDPAVPVARTYSHSQMVFAGLVVIVFAVLTYTGKVSGDATIALVSGITGAVLAAPLAAKASSEHARANGVVEGVEAAASARALEPEGVAAAAAARRSDAAARAGELD